MTRKVAFWGPLAFIGILFFIAFGGIIVWAVWNWVVPPLFGLPEVTFWQALGLLVLARILFGGMCGRRGYGYAGGYGSRREHIRRRVADRLVDRLADRVDEMSPEERDRIRRAIRERFGIDRDDSGREHDREA